MTLQTSRFATVAAVAGVAGLLCLTPRACVSAGAQRGGMFMGSPEDPAIAYSTAPVNNAVSLASQRLQDGTAQLTFEGRSGYLRSALNLLGLSIDSQVLVFSPTSFQRRYISEANPRALFFNDRVALGWVRDAEIIEVAAQDATQGMVFYTLDQRRVDRPAFQRVLTCLGCHKAGDTLGVPGMLMFSTTPPAGGDGPSRSVMTDHRLAFDRRWGGWFVTGQSGALRHRGNEASTVAAGGGALASVTGLFDDDGYQSMASDIVALLVLSHQIHMVNLITRVGWEARAADPMLHAPFVAAPGEERQIAQMMSGIAAEVVDYLLFVDEAPLADRIPGSSAFAQRFAALGPRDAKGRSLHALDLTRRLLKYPCSYEIYSAAFDALPASAKDPIYRRMWQVLSGDEAGERYRGALTLADRRAIVEILKDTKPDLPEYFHRVSR
ncbi:MAG TPA: hypothetical protein VKD69_09550 [Vicinamibacterales bacterium]|nr:hypothetical protein [Vicinamibacterales bacterium]